jgi:hypothetical protein
MNAIRPLERAAVDCHRAGTGWTNFWAEHGAAVCQAEPHNRQRFGRLVRRLLALVVAGDVDGMEPPGAVMPWDVDDQAQPVAISDTDTRARCLWPMAEKT